ncbi:MAG: alanine dehydrogenase, partial [Alphaproteobacteria bacterium]
MERDAETGSGLADARYVDAGARIVDGPEQAWDAAMVLKVKE